MALTYEVIGLEELRRRLNQGPTVARISLNDGLREIGKIFVPSKGSGPLAQETPKRTGRLARSSFFQITGGPDDQTLEILQPARSKQGVFYGKFVREGTRFMRANPYHLRVYNRLLPEVQDAVVRMGVGVVAFLSGGR